MSDVRQSVHLDAEKLNNVLTMEPFLFIKKNETLRWLKHTFRPRAQAAVGACCLLVRAKSFKLFVVPPKVEISQAIWCNFY